MARPVALRCVRGANTTREEYYNVYFDAERVTSVFRQADGMTVAGLSLTVVYFREGPVFETDLSAAVVAEIIWPGKWASAPSKS